MRAIESFLVRRLICRDSTRSYGALFIEVLQTAKNGPAVDADQRIIELLAGKSAEADRWPTDDQLRSAVLGTNIYKLKQSRLKMILEAIDAHRSQGGNVEQIQLGHALWIEHLLPQGWKDEPAWALPKELPDPTASSLERDHKLHTLGNLTLTTSKLDITLSNRPWAEKLEMLKLHTSLQLNRDLVSAAPPQWAELQITERGMQLASDAIAIWPRPPENSKPL